MPSALVAALAKAESRDASAHSKLAIGKDGCIRLPAREPDTRLQGCFEGRAASFKVQSQHVKLSFDAWGRAGAMHRIAHPQRVQRGNRVEYRSEGITEWWRVLPLGYEQGFTMAKAPSGRGRVVLRLRASAAPTLDHATLRWGSLRYGKLFVSDARGKALPASISVHGTSIRIAFDARRAMFPVTVDPLVWTQHAFFSPDGSDGGDHYGSVIAISADGSTVVVGAPSFTTSASYTNLGKAYVFVQANGAWTYAQALAAPDSQTGDRFGASLALSRDGSTLMVGAPGRSAVTTDGGEVYVFSKSAGTWGFTAEFSPAHINANFGWSLALTPDGLRALIGEPGNQDAYVYDDLGGTWTQTARLVPSDSAAGGFGMAVAMSGDGLHALAGAAGANEAFMFDDNAGTWTQTALLTGGDTQQFDNFGGSVALSQDGSTGLVGAPNKTHSISGDNAGAAYVFTRPSGTWTQQAELTDPNWSSFDQYFGKSVALSADGSTALIGMPTTLVNNLTSGSALVFASSSNAWTYDISLVPYDAFHDENFGTAVAMTPDMGTYLVGMDNSYFASDPAAAFAIAQADLSTTLSAPAAVGLGQNYSYQYIVTNNSAAKSSPLSISIALSGDKQLVQLVSTGATQGTCSYDSLTWTDTCDLGSVPGNGGTETATLTFKASSVAAGDIQALGRVVNATPDLSQSTTTHLGPPAPTISNISGTTANTNSTGHVNFTLSGTGKLTVTASVDNTSIFATNPNVATTCTSAGTCSVSFKTSSKTGKANVTLTVKDTYGQSGTATFVLSVVMAPTGGSSGGGGGGALGTTSLLLLGLMLLDDFRRSRKPRRT